MPPGNALCLDIDHPKAKVSTSGLTKSYKKFLADIPHLTLASAADRFPALFADLEASRNSPADSSQGQSHPPSFLTADDIDDYIWEIDNRTADAGLPTLAPMAHVGGSTANGGAGRKETGLLRKLELV